MDKEKRKILEHLVEYLQDKINTGYHKIFYNDDMYDEKTIDCINAINDTLEENERLKNIIEKIDEFISYKIIIEANAKGYQITLKDLTDIKKELLKLKGVDKV